MQVASPTSLVRNDDRRSLSAAELSPAFRGENVAVGFQALCERPRAGFYRGTELTGIGLAGTHHVAGADGFLVDKGFAFGGKPATISPQALAETGFPGLAGAELPGVSVAAKVSGGGG
jgi:hypothetical protein